MNAKPAAWTDEIYGVVFTNQGVGIFPSNTSSGVMFDASASSYFKNSANTVIWSNSICSTWIAFFYTNATAYTTLLGNESSGGHGYYTYNGTKGPGLLGLGDVYQEFCASAPSLNTPINLCVLLNGTSWTNGVQANNYTAHDSATDGHLWGIGKDNGGDPSFNGKIKFVLICTNYQFSAQDIANLNCYATYH